MPIDSCRVTPTTMAMPSSSARNCSSPSRRSSGETGSAANSATAVTGSERTRASSAAGSASAETPLGYTALGRMAERGDESAAWRSGLLGQLVDVLA